METRDGRGRGDDAVHAASAAAKDALARRTVAVRGVSDVGGGVEER